ncbi:putative RNA methyltransferase [Dietzia cinnamea]|uniref:putative RNA methyltransferase n=1 Tax=Dietzia cinnamea TaxID=321318 RepID=UPI0021A31899|nr:methyltransferase domain-containing protein [Dietzia cinnamea]MCT2138206.1 methyltransferase domain-containing protein [Dietzia cinnamea]
MTPGPALRRIVPLLRCPLCGEAMRATDQGVTCGSGHPFDRARQGYLSLFGPRGRRFPGDTADQVAARDRVLSSGLFDGVLDELAAVARDAIGAGAPAGSVSRRVVLEAGAGTGHYIAGVLDAVGRDAGGADVVGIGTEISAAAARRLARAHPAVAAVVADTWDGLPLADGCVDLVQVVFAPRNPSEFARVLRPGGTLVVAVPGEGHLEPLRSAGGLLEPAPDKAARLDSELAAAFEPGPVRVVDQRTEVPAAVAVDLALMGPSGVHLDRSRLEAALGADDRPVRLHVEVRSYRVPLGDRRY